LLKDGFVRFKVPSFNSFLACVVTPDENINQVVKDLINVREMSTGRLVLKKTHLRVPN